MYVFWAFKLTRIGHSKKRPQTREIAPYVGVHPDEERCDGQYLATAANAVDHAVERRVLLVDRIVWIHQVLLRGHLIGARLSMADRCGIRQQLLARVRRWRCGSISRTSRLSNRHGSIDQGQQRYRRDQLSHDGSPGLGAPSRSM